MRRWWVQHRCVGSCLRSFSSALGLLKGLVVLNLSIKIRNLFAAPRYEAELKLFVVFVAEPKALVVGLATHRRTLGDTLYRRSLRFFSHKEDPFTQVHGSAATPEYFSYFVFLL